MASPVFLLVRFGLSSPSSASSDALFLVWESLFIAFILTSSALALSALSLLYVSVGALSSSAMICCISSSNSLGSSGDIPDALSSAIIFFLVLVYQDIYVVPDGSVVNIKLWRSTFVENIYNFLPSFTTLRRPLFVYVGIFKHCFSAQYNIVLFSPVQYLLCENKNKENVRIKLTPNKPFLLI